MTVASLAKQRKPAKGRERIMFRVERGALVPASELAVSRRALSRLAFRAAFDCSLMVQTPPYGRAGGHDRRSTGRWLVR